MQLTMMLMLAARMMPQVRRMKGMKVQASDNNRSINTTYNNTNTDSGDDTAGARNEGSQSAAHRPA
jgi:hypothetical protein